MRLMLDNINLSQSRRTMILAAMKTAEWDMVVRLGGEVCGWI